MDIELYKHIKNSGVIEHKIRELADIDIFTILSKHDPYWNSKHQLEADKLENIRMILYTISSDLQEMLNIIDESDRRSFI